MMWPDRCLSGGNQQKALIARTLFPMRNVFSCSIPLAVLMLGRSKRSTPSSENAPNRVPGSLLYSTELMELTGLCDRCIVVYRNRIVGECHSNP